MVLSSIALLAIVYFINGNFEIAFWTIFYITSLIAYLILEHRLLLNIFQGSAFDVEIQINKNVSSIKNIYVIRSIGIRGEDRPTGGLGFSADYYFYRIEFDTRDYYYGCINSEFIDNLAIDIKAEYFLFPSVFLYIFWKKIRTWLF